MYKLSTLILVQQLPGLFSKALHIKGSPVSLQFAAGTNNKKLSLLENPGSMTVNERKREKDGHCHLILNLNTLLE